MLNLDEMAISGTFLAAVAGVMMINNIKAPDVALAPPAIASVEQAAEPEAAPPVKTISFTVTGKRMPQECKGEPASAEIAARCEALRNQTVVTVR